MKYKGFELVHIGGGFYTVEHFADSYSGELTRFGSLEHAKQVIDWECGGRDEYYKEQDRKAEEIILEFECLHEAVNEEHERSVLSHDKYMAARENIKKLIRGIAKL